MYYGTPVSHHKKHMRQSSRKRRWWWKYSTKLVSRTRRAHLTSTPNVSTFPLFSSKNCRETHCTCRFMDNHKEALWSHLACQLKRNKVREVSSDAIPVYRWMHGIKKENEGEMTLDVGRHERKALYSWSNLQAQTCTFSGFTKHDQATTIIASCCRWYHLVKMMRTRGFFHSPWSNWMQEDHGLLEAGECMVSRKRKRERWC